MSNWLWKKISCVMRTIDSECHCSTTIWETNTYLNNSPAICCYYGAKQKTSLIKKLIALYERSHLIHFSNILLKTQNIPGLYVILITYLGHGVACFLNTFQISTTDFLIMFSSLLFNNIFSLLLESVEFICTLDGPKLIYLRFIELCDFVLLHQMSSDKRCLAELIF